MEHPNTEQATLEHLLQEHQHSRSTGNNQQRCRQVLPMNSKEAMREVQAGSDTSVQATASNAATGKMSAAALGYFEDRFLNVLSGDRMGGEPRRRLPPVMNRGQISTAVVGEVGQLYGSRVVCIASQWKTGCTLVLHSAHQHY